MIWELNVQKDRKITKKNLLMLFNVEFPAGVYCIILYYYSNIHI